MEANGTYTFTMLFEPAEEGGYVVTCPALPGLVTEGDTLEQARRMAQDAIHAYVERLREDHLPIPSDKPPGKKRYMCCCPGPRSRKFLRSRFGGLPKPGQHRGFAL